MNKYYLACSLFFAMASLTKITATSSVVLHLQRPIAAYSSVAWNNHTRQRHHNPHLRLRPSSVPLLSATTTTNVRLQHPSNSRSQFSSQIFMTADDDIFAENRTTPTTVNIPLLKKEIIRLTLRTHKKIDKASTRIRGAEEQYNKLRLAIDANSSDDGVDEKLMQQLEQAPNVEQYKQELKELQDRLQKLNWLEVQFNIPPLKSKKELSYDELEKLVPNEGGQIIQYILDLEISDDYESQKQKKIEMDANYRRAKKEKSMQLKEQNSQQPKQGGRLPYRRYYSEQHTEIRVGKQATDNDMLSLSPEHRSGSHWWYHASGCSGSHVVLCTDASSPAEEDILDAASLAALKSKCIGQSVIKVSMTRARNVSKPPGAKPGLVQLNGDIRTITIRKSEVEKRCLRLEQTVVVN
ncbi:hypothetical protein ACHAXH_008928 [Discostella pseudostelligera]